MKYVDIAVKMTAIEGVEISTMMNTPCLRFNGQFMAMMFVEHNALIIKVSPERVNELIAEGRGEEFNFTKKRFKEWVQIPQEFEGDYEAYIREALVYAKAHVKAHDKTGAKKKSRS
jgi:hypothetical protein